MKNKEQKTKTFHDHVDNSWKNNKVIVIILYAVKIIGGLAAFLTVIYNLFCSKHDIKSDIPPANHQVIIGDGNNQAGRDISITSIEDSTAK